MQRHAYESEITTARLRLKSLDSAGFDVLRIPEAAQETIDDLAFLVLGDDVKINPLDSHRLLCQLKVAAALMALDGRYYRRGLGTRGNHYGEVHAD
jgi:hypothetical protein